MREFNHEGDFVGVFRKIRGRCQQKKARVVFTAVLQMFSQNNSAVLLSRPFSRDSRPRLLTRFKNSRHTPGSVFSRYSLKLRISRQETPALVECDWMRFHGCNLVKGRAGTADQTLIDWNNDFADDEQFAIKKQVEAGMNETRETVLNGSKDVIGSFVTDGVEERLETRTSHEGNVLTKQTNRCLLTERAPGALKRDPRATVRPFEFRQLVVEA